MKKFFSSCIVASFALLFLIANIRAEGVVAEVEVVRKEDIPATIPQASEIDTLNLIEASRGALATAVDFLINKCQTNYLTFAIPPITHRPVIGYEEKTPYEVRYREEKVQVPIYKDIYEEYETFSVGGGSSTEARKIGKVKAHRWIGREKIGSKEEKRLIPDPNGPIVQTHYRYGKPIFGEGQDFYQNGNWGANALVYVALRKCGVPEDHPVLDNMMRQFEMLLNDYAIPDDTWSVAWLTAAFCNTKQERYKELRNYLISKLIDGQIKEGPGRGFWGPVCINAALIPAMLEYEQELGKQRDAAKQAAKEKPDNKKLQKQYEETEVLLENYILYYRWVTQQGLRFPPQDNCTSRYNSRKREGIQPVNVAGIPYSYFNQALADMESTFYAMFAIKEAADNGFLLEETLRWKTATGKPVAPPEKTSAVLARMAAALASRQKENGQWDECNTHQPITTFKPLGLPDLKLEEVLQLASPITHLSTCQGYACLLAAGKAVGFEKLWNKYGQNAVKGMNAQNDSSRSYLAGQPAGRLLEPYDFIFSLTGIHRYLGSNEETRRNLWTRMAYRLVTLQNPNGTWGKPSEMICIHSSSIKEFLIKSAEAAHNKAYEKKDDSQKPPFNPDAWWRNYSWGQYGYMERQIINTAMAMIFLADGVRLPVCGYVPKAGAPKTLPPLMNKVLEIIKTKDNIEPTYLTISTNMIAADLAGIPVVFVTQDTDLSVIPVFQALKGYCLNGGTIIAETTSTAISSLQPKLLGLVEGGKIIPIAEDATFFKNFQGPKPKLNGIVNAKGRITIIMIPLDTIQASPAIQTSYLIIKDNVVDGFFDQDYAWKCLDKEGALMRIRALPQLKAEAAITAAKTDKPAAPAAKEDTGTIVQEKQEAPTQPAGPKADEEW